MSVIGVIPARGGSKGIPRKCLVACGGKPLLAYTCAAARQSQRLERCLISTDDPEIAEFATTQGIEVPWLRPAELAQDDTPMVAVLAHALAQLQASGVAVTALVLLQPTSPLRQAHHIDGAVDLFWQAQADTVVSVVAVPHQFNPVSVQRLEQGQLQPYLPQQPLITRRQDKPVVYARNGPAVLVVKPAVIARQQLYGDRTCGYVMDTQSSLDIDMPADLELVEALLWYRQARLSPQPELS